MGLPVKALAAAALALALGDPLTDAKLGAAELAAGFEAAELAGALDDAAVLVGALVPPQADSSRTAAPNSAAPLGKRAW